MKETLADKVVEIMANKIICPHCHRQNEVQKFCIFCGERLIDDEHFRLMEENPEPTCLNCGRLVLKGQIRCECGYEFKHIKCPNCQTANEYTSRFCISCGEKLWRSDVYLYKYDDSHFKRHLFEKHLPSKLRNISIAKRCSSSNFLKPVPGDSIEDRHIKSLQLMDSMVDGALNEIRSRWKVVSPRYCISCLGTVMPYERFCTKCGCAVGNTKRSKQLRGEKNTYVKPEFTIEDIKMAFFGLDHYLGSLAPAIGESQFEYRERLKWEFAENIIRKNNIKMTVPIQEKPAVQHFKFSEKSEPRKGGYCSFKCRHYREDIVDAQMGYVGDYTDNCWIEYYCDIGHSINEGSYCKDFK